MSKYLVVVVVEFHPLSTGWRGACCGVYLALLTFFTATTAAFLLLLAEVDLVLDLDFFLGTNEIGSGYSPAIIPVLSTSILNPSCSVAKLTFFYSAIFMAAWA